METDQNLVPNFDARLFFSSANEDSRSELAALAGPCGRLLTLTGSGARALDMVLGEATEIVSIDTNPLQNGLLALKIAAFRALEYPELLSYLGLTRCADRAALHVRVRRALAPDWRRFWDDHAELALGGVWYAGVWEKVLGRAGRAHRLLRGRALAALLESPDTNAQLSIWNNRFDNAFFKVSLRILSAKWLWTNVIGEPGGAYLPPAQQVQKLLCDRFERAAQSTLFRDGDFAMLMLTGRHDAMGALPLHMLPDNFKTVRQGVDRISMFQGELGSVGICDLGPFDAFSLSDFGSYADQETYDQIWRGVTESAAPNAKFCERVFLNPLVPSAPNIQIDTALSRELTHKDRAVIYEIRAGHITNA